MAIEEFDGIRPQVPESAFVAASADVIGRVTLGEESFCLLRVSFEFIVA